MELNEKQRAIRDEAIKLLEEMGYASMGMWQVEDVQREHKFVSDDEAMQILEDVLCSDYITEMVFQQIDIAVKEMYSDEKTDAGLDIPYQMYEDEIVRMKMEGATKEEIQKRQQDEDKG
ncbi:MAG: hypothetical protein ACTSPB_15365 [Candidatus Thorarchaeota archaeon]